MPEILPRFNAAMQRIEDARKLGAILLEVGDAHPANDRVYRRSADGHNRDRSRGVPIIRRGVGGTSTGTDPLAALLAKEARGQLRLSKERPGLP